MGACNFRHIYCGIGGAFGYVPEYPTPDEIAEAREANGWDDHDDDTIAGWVWEDRQEYGCMWQTSIRNALEDRIAEVLWHLWDFGKYGLAFPYTLQVEAGYYDGWRVVLESEYCYPQHNDETAWFSWCELVGRFTTDPDVVSQYDTSCPNVPYENYCKHLEKVSDAVVWVFEETVRREGLAGVSGGWTGGEYVPDEDDFTPIKYREKWEQRFGHLF